MATKPEQTRTDPVSARVALINGNFDLPEESVQAMKNIRKAVSDAAEIIERESKRVKHDVGRLIAAVDTLQQAKDVACVSVILPHYKPQEPVKDESK